MFSYQIIDNKNLEIDTNAIDNIFTSISNTIDDSQIGVINIVFVDDEKIRELNKTYRNIDKATDVLSFHYFDDFSDLKADQIAWEVVVSINKIELQAHEYWVSQEQEFYKLLIHSLFHILWYDHIEDHDYKTMQEKEDLVYKEVFEK